MTIRKGMGKGKGMGYKNLLIGYDKRVHKESGQGFKQPQRVGRMLVVSRFTRGKDMPVKKVSEMFSAPKATPAQKGALGSGFVPVSQVAAIPKKEKTAEFTEIRADKGEIKPRSGVSHLLSEISTGALRRGREYLTARKAAATEKREKAHEQYIEELRDVEHPLVKKRDKIEERIGAIEDKIAAGVGDESKLFDELGVLKEELKEAEAKLENIDVGAFTDEQLKALAVRDRESDDMFSMETGNKYERELLRRIEYRKELDKKMHEAHLTKKKDEGGLFDF